MILDIDICDISLSISISDIYEFVVYDLNIDMCDILPIKPISNIYEFVVYDLGYRYM